MHRLFFPLVVVATFFACNKDDDDQLNGKWQLKQIEAGSDIQQVDSVYYNFQTSLFSYQISFPSTMGTSTQLYGFKTWEKEDELTLEFDEKFPNREAFREQYTDWPEVRRTFRIEKLSRTELIMTSDGKRYVFHSF